jgi:hypothetical protein
VDEYLPGFQNNEKKHDRKQHGNQPRRPGSGNLFHARLRSTARSGVRQAGKTSLTMRMLFPSTASRDHVVEKYGATKGANQTLGRRAEQLGRMAAGRDDARGWPAVVFRAWTDPAYLRLWWGQGILDSGVRSGCAAGWRNSNPDAPPLWRGVADGRCLLRGPANRNGWCLPLRRWMTRATRCLKFSMSRPFPNTAEKRS